MRRNGKRVYEWHRGKPTTKITRDIYSRIIDRWAELDMMEYNVPVKATVIDEDLEKEKGYVEGNVHFSWSNVIDWFGGKEGRKIKEVLWEMGIE